MKTYSIPAQVGLDLAAPNADKTVRTLIILVREYKPYATIPETRFMSKAQFINAMQFPSDSPNAYYKVSGSHSLEELRKFFIHGE